MRLSLLALSCLVAGVVANNDNGHKTGHGNKPTPTITTCIVEHTKGADDVPGLSSAVSACATNGVIEFKKGTTYNIWSPAHFENLVNSTISIQGNLTLPENMTEVQNQVTNDKHNVGRGYWFVVTGTNVNIQGNDQNKKWGWIECHGQQWWDQESPSSTVDARPHLMYLKPTGAAVDSLKISQPVAWSIKVAGSNIHMNNVQIQAVSNDPWILPFNTDGMDVGGTNITVENAHVVNGDDCLTLNDGAANVVFRNSYCENGHGVSIGSLGSDPTDITNVQNFTAENIYVKNSLYGARFKAWLNGQGTVQNILYKNFYTDNCTIPIFITQSYYDQTESTGDTEEVYQSINLVNFNFSNFRGSIDGYTQYRQIDPSGTWWAVPGLTGRDAIVMECPSTEACAGLHFSDIDISANWNGSHTTEVWCQNGIDSTLGFDCVNGTLVMN